MDASVSFTFENKKLMRAFVKEASRRYIVGSPCIHNNMVDYYGRWDEVNRLKDFFEGFKLCYDVIMDRR